MSRLNLIKYSLNGGEISPLSLGRVDQERYPTCLERCYNFVPLIQGGVTRRPGTRYISPAAGPSRLIPFIFDITHAFILEFGNQTIGVYTPAGGQVVPGAGGPAFSTTIGGTTHDGSVTWTCRGLGTNTRPVNASVSAGYCFIDKAYSHSIQQCQSNGFTGLGYPHFNSFTGTLTRDGAVSAINWLNCGTGHWAPATSYNLLTTAQVGGTIPTMIVDGNGNFQQVTTAGVSSASSAYTIPSPYDTSVDNLWDIKYVQVLNTMYLVHPNHPPQKLNRLGDANWVLTQPAFYSPPTHDFDRDYSNGVINISLSGTGPGSVTCVASAPFFIQGDVGTAVVAGTGVGFITSLSGATATDGATGAILYQNASLNVIDTFNTTSYPAGTWFIRGSPQSYIADTVIQGGNFNFTHKIGLGGQSDIYGMSKYPVPGHPLNKQDTFRVLDNGLYLVFDGAVLQISQVVDSSHVIATRISAYSILRSTADGVQVPDAASGGEWTIELPAFSPVHGYPRAVCFFQGRLWFAGTTDQKQSIWGSVTDDFENFAKGQTDDAGLDFTVSSGIFEQILWMAPFQGNIICGTYEGEYIINGGSGQLISTGVGATVTPTNVSILLQSLYGSTPIQPVIIQNDLIYVQRGKLTTYQFTFNIYQSVFASKNLNLLNSIVTTSGFKEIVYQQNPYFQVWFTDLTGNLVGLTYEKLNDVWGWHRVFTGTDTADQIISVATIPSQDQLRDDLWLVCQRTLNGTTTYTIEIMDTDLYVDCASKAVFNPPVMQISGLSYLNGRTVWLNIDGMVLGPIVQNGDTYKFPPGVQGTNVQIGLNYISEALTVRPEVSAGGQSIQGLIGNWTRIWARTVNSSTLSINNQLVHILTPSDPLDVGLPYLSRDIRLEANIGYDFNKRIDIKQINPLPTTVTALFGSLEIGEQ